MVARHLIILHNDDEFAVDYDTDDGFEVLKFLIYSLTAVPPDEQELVVEDGGMILTESSDLASISYKVRLVTIGDEELARMSIGGGEESVNTSKSFEKSDEELARMLQAEEEALLFQEFHVSKDREEFEQTIRPHIAQILMYEDPIRQDAARKSVPVEELEEDAFVALAKEGNFKPSKDEQQHAFLLQLLFWFKRSFRWVNSPTCDRCGNETSNIGMGVPLPSEAKFGSSRVELYRCGICLNITRFPRYNDPLKLVETRRGRCGEWANCFTLYCRAFGYQSRLILDFTDHLWTECFSQFLKRWIHLDPCEGIFDKPLLYEKGWNKKLNYVIAVAKDGVYDVTKRYTRKWHEVLLRRNITVEVTASAVLSDITKELRNGYSSEDFSMLKQRDEKEMQELENGIAVQTDDSMSLPGRQSGAIEWRIARSEWSPVNGPFRCSSCPVRICVDEHVRGIYDAYSYMIRHFINELSKDKSVEILDSLKNMLVDLKNSSFKTRSCSLNICETEFSENTIDCIERWLSAISLKREEAKGGTMTVTLAGDPIKTSIALQVALDAISEIIVDFCSGMIAGKDIMQFPRSNRLTSGRVLASGEEIPFGIANAAFDGTSKSKWEEPDGAKGCWLIYNVTDGLKYDLVSYDLQSANDAPERDPMDWIIEGSEDGGVTWNVLDKQSSQKFEKRFQRKMFTVDVRHQSNLFRFNFLKVRDSRSQSRFQIGSIDLYVGSTISAEAGNADESH